MFLEILKDDTDDLRRVLFQHPGRKIFIVRNPGYSMTGLAFTRSEGQSGVRQKLIEVLVFRHSPSALKEFIFVVWG